MKRQWNRTLFVVITVCASAAAVAALPRPIADEQMLGGTTDDPFVRRFITPSRVFWRSDAD